MTDTVAVAIVVIENNLFVCDLLEDRKWSFTAVDLLPSIGDSKEAAPKAGEEFHFFGKEVVRFIKQNRLVKALKLLVIY